MTHCFASAFNLSTRDICHLTAQLMTLSWRAEKSYHFSE